MCPAETRGDSTTSSTGGGRDCERAGNRPKANQGCFLKCQAGTGYRQAKKGGKKGGKSLTFEPRAVHLGEILRASIKEGRKRGQALKLKRRFEKTR